MYKNNCDALQYLTGAPFITAKRYSLTIKTPLAPIEMTTFAIRIEVHRMVFSRFLNLY